MVTMPPNGRHLTQCGWLTLTLFKLVNMPLLAHCICVHIYLLQISKLEIGRTKVKLKKHASSNF